MHWNILKIGAVQFLLVMSSLLAAAASPVKLPEWAVNLEDGEYLGVSFPGGGQRQAEAMALMAMYDMNYKLGENARLIVNNEFSYDVKNVELLSSGETVVVLVDGESVSRNVKMVKEIYSSEVAVKCEMAIRVEGQWEMYVNIYKIKNNYNLACKWSDYMETEPGLWVHDGEKGAVNQNMCDKIELRPYTVAGSHIGNEDTFDSVVEIEAGKYFLSESMLINEVEQAVLPLASISFQKGKQVFSFRAPVYSAWRDKGVRRALNDLTPGEVDEAKYIDSLTTALRQYYIRSVSAGIQDRNSQSILYYNSEKEMFLIRDAHFGYVSVPVPEEDHGAFEKQFDALKREYEYDIADDRLALISVTYTTTDGRTYRSSDVSGS